MGVPFPCSSLQALVFLSCICFCLKGCQAQMVSPFSGQGIAPGLGSDFGLQDLENEAFYAVFTPVYISCYLDRLLKVNEQEYGFEAVIFMQLSWDDPRAFGEIARRTNETYAVGKDKDCERPCHVQFRQCCDSLWLPGLDLVNVWGLPQDRVDYELINLNPNNRTNIDWTRRFNGVFYTPMNFRRFPFDRQVLMVEFWGQSCCHELRASSVSTRITTSARGNNKAADLSSWKVTNVTLECFRFNLSELVAGGTLSNPTEPWALKPVSHEPLTYSNFGVLPVPDSLRIYITIDRLSWYYVISYMCPMILCVVLSWWTFSISPRSIETRMSVLVSLFLSLTALQFIISSQLPASSYITVMGWIVVVSYFIIALATAETILVYCVFRWYVHGRDKQCISCQTSVRGVSALVSNTAEGSERPRENEDDNPSLRATHAVHEKGVDEMPPADGSGESPAPSSEPRRGSAYARLLTLRRPEIRRLLSANPLRSTFDITRRFESSLKRDLSKANAVIARIETFSMCAFPLTYAVCLIAIIFAI